MRFLLDANLPKSLIKDLRRRFRIRCSRVKDSRSDELIYKRVKREGMVLLSLDTDFLNILKYPPGKDFGIVVFRIKVQNRRNVVRMVIDFVQTVRSKLDVLLGSTVVVREDRFKVFSFKP